MPFLAALFFALVGAGSGALYYYALDFWTGLAQVAAIGVAVVAAAFVGARFAPVKSASVVLLCGAVSAVLAIVGLTRGEEIEKALILVGDGVMAVALLAFLVNPGTQVKDRLSYLRRSLPIGAAAGLAVALAPLDPLGDGLRRLAAGGLAWTVAGALLVQLQLLLPQIREHTQSWQQDFAQSVADQVRERGEGKSGETWVSGTAALAIYLIMGLMGGGMGARAGVFAVVLGLVLDALFGGTVTTGPAYWMTVGAVSWLLYLLAPPPEPAESEDEDDEDEDWDEEDEEGEEDEDEEDEDEDEQGPRRWGRPPRY
jgi:hypothetical protein